MPVEEPCIIVREGNLFPQNILVASACRDSLTQVISAEGGGDSLHWRGGPRTGHTEDATWCNLEVCALEVYAVLPTFLGTIQVRNKRGDAVILLYLTGRILVSSTSVITRELGRLKTRPELTNQSGPDTLHLCASLAWNPKCGDEVSSRSRCWSGSFQCRSVPWLSGQTRSSC